MFSDFNSVEAELREIEADFASGRMNAFGSAQAQDAFLRELKRIAEVETHVFYKTCCILKGGNSDDHTLLTDVFASAQPPPQARGTTSPGRTGAAGRAPSTSRTNHGGGTRLGDSLRGAGGNSPPPLSFDTSQFSRSLPGGATTQSGDGGASSVGGGSRMERTVDGPAPHIKSSQWGNEAGFPDRVFEDVAERFRMLEADFDVLGDQLRQISSHVMRLNDMSEEVNRHMAVGSKPGDEAAGGKGSSGNPSINVGGGAAGWGTRNVMGDVNMTTSAGVPVVGVGSRSQPVGPGQDTMGGSSTHRSGRGSGPSGLNGDPMENSFDPDMPLWEHPFDGSGGGRHGGMRGDRDRRSRSPEDAMPGMSRTAHWR